MSNLEIEKEGVELANKKQYAQARAHFELVLPSKTVPLQRAQVLENIMQTYLGDGKTVDAIKISALNSFRTKYRLSDYRKLANIQFSGAQIAQKIVPEMICVAQQPL
jgi:hypothetical protein